MTTGETEQATRDGGDGVPPDGTSLLSLRGLTKTFGPVRALTRVDLNVPPGQVTALVGDNGAGKSVTIKTISGLWAPDGGEILWEGRPVHFHGPKDAEALGIRTIYQDLALCDNLDIVQNMFLGHEPLRRGVLDEDSMEIAARKTLEELHVRTVRSIRMPVASLSGGQRQSVAVAKAVLFKAQLVIMDEPTAALGVSQTRQVLDLIKRLSTQGVTVMVVSHNLNDVFEVADRIAILYLGRLVAEDDASKFDRQVVVEYMTTGQSSRGPETAGVGARADQQASERTER
ncbi:MAG: sugar ABC transporter ATP-binding protein [Solirubrobacterales bacterium]|nr:sugar ABC transporter ATP-binding protein [Solirubrobacterales bacterium]